jgi:hypothetical protein
MRFARHPGIKNATEQAPMERNNNQGMLPKNRSGKDDEVIKMTHTLTTRKEGADLEKPGTTATETFEYINTDKLDPTIGPSCKIEQATVR